MDAALPALTEMPSPQFVMSGDGRRIATYSWGDESGPTVLCVHGFASSCRDNWVGTGWVRDLTRAGFRVLGVDQRGHGASDKPHEASAFSMDALVDDIATVLDTYLLDTVSYAGYSLGARVGWQVAVQLPVHVERAVLGGIPDGRPLARLQIEQARAYAEHGTPVEDAVTGNYVTLAERVHGNDLRALVALAEGMRLGDADPDPTHPPRTAHPVRHRQRRRDPAAVASTGRCHAERHVPRVARPTPLQRAGLARVPSGGGRVLHGIAVGSRHPQPLVPCCARP